MKTLILYLLIYIAEALIFHWYCSRRFIKAHSKHYIFTTFLISYGALFVLSRIESFALNTIFFTLANTLIIKIVYDTRFGAAIFHALITTCMMSFSEIAIIGLSSQFNGTILYSLSNITYLSILTIASKLLYLFGLNMLARLLPYSPEELAKRGLSSLPTPKKSEINKATALLNFVPFISIYIIIVLLGVLLNTDINNKLRYMLSSCAVLLIFINILTFYIYHYTLEKNSELTKLQLQYQKEYDMAAYYKTLFTQNENQQLLIHDIRKHLMSISKLSEQNDNQKIQSYLSNLLNSSELQNSVHISDNEMLNAIICHYLQICSNKHIELKTDIRKQSLTFFDYSDLTTLLCNLLENAIEACTNIPDSYIELSITAKENTSLSIINIVNTCRIRPQFDKNNRPVTTKRNKSHHGLGLKSVERVVNKYRGNIKMYFDDDKLTFHTIIVVKNDSASY